MLCRPELQLRRSEWVNLRPQLDRNHRMENYVLRYDPQKLCDEWVKIAAAEEWYYTPNREHTHFFRICLLHAPARPPRVRAKSFPSFTCRIYVYWFRVVIGLQLVLEPYPQHPPDAISVRQAKGLRTASFRFPVTEDTLAVRLCASHHRARSGLSPVRFRPCRAHKTSRNPLRRNGFRDYFFLILRGTRKTQKHFHILGV